MVSALRILVLGGVGVQNSYVVRELVKVGHKVGLLSRNPEYEEPASLAALGVEIIKGDTYHAPPPFRTHHPLGQQKIHQPI